MSSQFEVREHPDPTFMVDFFTLFPIIMVIYMGLFFGWFWSIAIGLQKHIPIELRLNLKKFKIFFFIPLLYILFFMMLISSTFYNVSSGDHAAAGIMSKMMLFIVPMHLFSMFCMFYLLYVSSKTIKTVELQKNVSFSDFIGEFFMIWFFPIGIWFIQPRINKIVSETSTLND
ncbi:hypothetical protein [Psychroserpens damuponensis]|uniref:hypothetical protein n=1 Tax=Psychroserpens damuponensis TaxID=943936 RepID=UPI00058BB62F|nr:hypothetical protein [Psychroserpens damuponensis]